MPASVDIAALEVAADKRFSNEPRPFLKWAGSKQALLRHLTAALPEGYGNYYEPFLGGGALFFLLKPKKAFLSDQCKPLIETFQAVKDNPQAVLRHLKHKKVSKTEYYATRDNSARGKYKKAADFIYLNKTCWNGLYRVNADGKFNVPYGLPKTTNVISSTNLKACSATLKSASLEVKDFETAVKDAKSEDLVYFDPPYVTGHQNNGFCEWNEKLFSWTDQERLAKLAHRLMRRGVHVIVSNAAHPEIAKLYKGFSAHNFERQSTLASSAKFRRKVGETLYCSN